VSANIPHDVRLQKIYIAHSFSGIEWGASLRLETPSDPNRAAR
jgi:hypothetical protein